MNKAISVALSAALLTCLPATAQDGFNQAPNNSGFTTQNPSFQPQQQPQPSFQQPQPQPQPSFNQPQPQPQPTPSFNQPQPQPNQSDMMMQQLQQMAQLELQDYGVQPTQQLHSGAMHGPTPNSIPGARTITTAEVFQMVMGGQPYLLFDVLGGDQTLPGAIPAVNASQPGSFQDQTQQGFGQFLQQVTNGQQNAPLIFYCASTQCWMSYNAALRAANLGYRNVLWYRGGLEAWSYAGLPTMPAGGNMMPQNPGGAMAPNGGGMMMPNMNGGGAMMPNMGN